MVNINQEVEFILIKKRETLLVERYKPNKINEIHFKTEKWR